MVPLLQAPSLNPHATLITLFMNVVPEYSMLPGAQLTDLARGGKTVMPRVLKFLSQKGMPTGPDLVKIMYAMGCVATYDGVLDM